VVQQVVQQIAQAPVEAGTTPAAAQGAKPGKATSASTAAASEVAQKEPPKAEPAALDAEAARRLWARWKEFLAAVKTQSGQQVTAALQAVRDVAVSDQVVAFAFGNNEFSRNMVAKPEVLPKVTAVLSTFLGRDVALECQMGDTAHLAGRLVSVTEAASSGPDPLIEFAVSDLGAQVLED
jgi:hypothetical protein